MRHPAYRRTQTGWPLWMLLAGCLVTVTGTVLADAAAAWPDRLIVAGAVAGQLSAALGLGWLTVEVDADALEWRFGALGRPRWRLRMAEIASVAPARSQWREGWGIRKTAQGMLYNAGGFDAVRLKLHDGRTIRLGSDEPARLAAFIEARLPRR